MKLSVLQENLSHGLTTVARAVSPRSTLPVLANILVATEDGRLRLTGTNLELGITCWIGAKVAEEGATTVPARTFVDLVNTLPADRVEMELTLRTQTLNVRAGAFDNNIKCIDAQEFPPMPPADLGEGVLLEMQDLREMINQVAFAASSDDARPVLSGVLVEIDGTHLTLAAADGFRLSVRRADLSAPVSSPLRAIVPARALAELARISSDEQVHMLLPPGRGQVIFRGRDIELVSQLIEGAFPDYQGIIPSSHTNRTVLSTAAFLKACKAADIFAREAAHSARLKIAPGSELEPGRIEVTATAAETGSNEVIVDATVDGEPIEIAFNVRFLVDVLSVINSPNVALETSGPAAPGVIKPVGRDDFLHVVMPMHLGR
jgi:DNA polymerase-3 subunit beta